MQALDDRQVDAVDSLFASGDEPTPPGPRRARTLDEHVELAAQQSARRRRTTGIVIIVLGLAVAGLAVAGFAGKDRSPTKAATSTSTTAAAAARDAKDGAGATTVSTKVAGATIDNVKPHWPSSTSGRPAAFGPPTQPPSAADTSALEDGFYLWQDFQGWHVYQVGGTGDDRITVTGDAEMAKADGLGGEVAIDKTLNHFTFSRGAAGDKVVGVDFNPGYYARTLVVAVEGKLRLHVGARRWIRPNYFGIAFLPAAD